MFKPHRSSWDESWATCRQGIPLSYFNSRQRETEKLGGAGRAKFPDVRPHVRNIADALHDAVTTNGWRFVDWTSFLGAKGFPGRPSDGDVAHQRQGLRSIWVGGRYTPSGVTFTSAKIAFLHKP